MDRRNSERVIRKLRKEYVLALSILLLTLLVSQFFIQYTIRFTEDDSRVINIAGRQRMLSQRISKSAYGLYNSSDDVNRVRYLNELQASLALWEMSHKGLQYGDEALGLPGTNSPQVVAMYQEIQSRYDAILKAAARITQIGAEYGYRPESLLPSLQIIMAHEAEFLRGMDAIVFRYDTESKQKISEIKDIEIVILLLSLLVLGLEVLYIFRPAIKHVDNALQEVEAGKDLLAMKEELLQTTMSSIGVAVLVTDVGGKITYMNPLAEKLTGWSLEEADGKDYKEVYHNINTLTRRREVYPVSHIIETGTRLEANPYAALIARDGSEIRIGGSATPIRKDDGSIAGVVISVRDISREYEMEQEVEAFLDINLDMLCVTDLEDNFIKVNRTFEEVLGYKTEELVGKNYLSLVHEKDLPETLGVRQKFKENTGVIDFTNRYLCKDGSYKYLEWRSQLGHGRHVYSSARDVTEKRRLEEQLRNLAIRDELTGMYNRHYLDTIVNKIMEHADRFNEPLSLLLLDLDHFKQVNDTWGHPVGDDYLKWTARIISETCREADLLFRFGGEEFVVVLPQTAQDGAQITAEKIRLAIQNREHPLAGKRTISIGLAQRMKAESFRHWYQRSDAALYQAKDQGRNRVVVAEGASKVSLAALQREWSRSWESGHEETDGQHRKINALGNRLVRQAVEEDNQQELAHLAEQLLEEVASHYRYEEKIMAETAYPDCGKHSEIHKSLMDKAFWLKEINKRGELETAAFLSFILDDVIHSHMEEEDTKFFPYL